MIEIVIELNKLGPCAKHGIDACEECAVDFVNEVNGGKYVKSKQAKAEIFGIEARARERLLRDGKEGRD